MIERYYRNGEQLCLWLNGLSHI